MSTTSKPRDRLEALLTGLEDEVLQMDDRAVLSPDDDGASMDIDVNCDSPWSRPSLRLWT